MQLHEAVYEHTINPFIGGYFDFNQLQLPVSPNQVQFEGLPDPDEILELYQYLDDDEKHEFDKLLAADMEIRPMLPHQIIPWWRDDWEVFALEGGRGVGKTITGTNGVMEHIYAIGRRARVGIAAPTNTLVRDICMEGETGLMTLFGKEFTHYARSLGSIEARHKNGAFVRAMGTEKPSAWNGPQWSLLWIDEYALCNRIALIDAFLGLRLGPKTGPHRARALVTFTPKGMKWTTELMARPDVYVPYYIGEDGLPRKPTTFDNPYLPERRVKEWKRDLLGTTIGRRELLALESFGVVGAKWNTDMIHHELNDERWPRFLRTVVAIDPAGTHARLKADENAATLEDIKEGRRNSQTSICVKTKGSDGKIYTLAWVAGRWTPNQWATKAVELYRVFRADRIVAERNFGGDMVESTIRNVWPDAPITIVTASKGKETRAEPVVTLYEQGREVHCAVFDKAEHQLCSFIDADHNEGADYVDSGVWATFELMGWSQNFPLHIMGGLDELNMFVMP